jgi:hypothetical protein
MVMAVVAYLRKLTAAADTNPANLITLDRTMQ